MNWVAENHYAMIVHQERLARASRSGQGLDLLQVLREGLSALRNKLAVEGQRRPVGAAHPSTANVRPLEAQ
jgi:hypothetical protein